MIITVDSPGAHLKRYDLGAFPQGELKLLEEPYDHLDMEGARV